MNTNKHILTYVRNRKNNLVGAVVAIGPNQVGWSMCMPVDRPKRLSDFKKLAIELALERASNPIKTEVPHTARRVYSHMLARSIRYFKQ